MYISSCVCVWVPACVRFRRRQVNMRTRLWICVRCMDVYIVCECVGNILMGFHTLKSLTLWYFSILLGAGRVGFSIQCVREWVRQKRKSGWTVCVLLCATRFGRMVSSTANVVDIDDNNSSLPYPHRFTRNRCWCRRTPTVKSWRPTHIFDMHSSTHTYSTYARAWTIYSY